jgi:hypothetical protein
MLLKDMNPVIYGVSGAFGCEWRSRKYRITAPMAPTSRPGGQSRAATRKQAVPAPLSKPGTRPEPPKFEAIASNTLERIPNTTKPKIDA